MKKTLLRASPDVDSAPPHGVSPPAGANALRGLSNRPYRAASGTPTRAVGRFRTAYCSSLAGCATSTAAAGPSRLFSRKSSRPCSSRLSSATAGTPSSGSSGPPCSPTSCCASRHGGPTGGKISSASSHSSRAWCGACEKPRRPHLLLWDSKTPAEGEPMSVNALFARV